MTVGKIPVFVKFFVWFGFDTSEILNGEEYMERQESRSISVINRRVISRVPVQNSYIKPTHTTECGR